MYILFGGKGQLPKHSQKFTVTSMRLRIYFGGASPNCGAGVRPYLIRRPALAHKNPTYFSRGSMSMINFN